MLKASDAAATRTFECLSSSKLAETSWTVGAESMEDPRICGGYRGVAKRLSHLQRHYTQIVRTVRQAVDVIE
jgi:hypothetical protein